MEVKKINSIPEIIVLDEVPSTNEYAKSILPQSPIEGTIILAKNQVSGRGQRNTKWVSEPNKNLTFSIIVYPEFLPVERQFLLSQITCLSILNFLRFELELHEISIKWPNDIFFRDKKIAGMLIESSISSNNINYSIIGIGINVNQEKFPPDVPNPSSLKLITNREYDIESLLVKYNIYFFSYLEQLRNGFYDKIHESYNQNLYLKDQEANFEIETGDQFIGYIKKSLVDGRVKIHDLNGTKRLFRFKEVRYLG